MPYVLRPAQPTDNDALAAFGVILDPPRKLTEADLFVYPSSETWLAERGGTIEAAMRLCYSSLSGHALLTDLCGDPNAVRPLASELIRIAQGRGAHTVEAATPSDAPLIAPLAELGLDGYRRVVHIVWQLPSPAPGEPPDGVRVMEEVPDPDEYARLAVEAYRGTWDWLFERWGGDVAARRNFARLFESPRGERFYAARSAQGVLMGFTSYGNPETVPGDFSTFGVLVRPADRGQGIGRHLLLTALQQLHLQGSQRVHMHTTAPPQKDPSAVLLYLGSGGERVEDILILRLASY
ncbi:MAG: GNAT family N-acetyltransferase [Thermaerobacter sp.]|nr:GNAT family N-acetyltransferase [Thermaerobacter sp.]